MRVHVHIHTMLLHMYAHRHVHMQASLSSVMQKGKDQKGPRVAMIFKRKGFQNPFTGRCPRE